MRNNNIAYCPDEGDFMRLRRLLADTLEGVDLEDAGGKPVDDLDFDLEEAYED